MTGLYSLAGIVLAVYLVLYLIGRAGDYGAHLHAKADPFNLEQERAE